MKKQLLVLFLLVFCGSNAQEADMKKTITTFFEGFHTADTIKMKSTLSREVVLHSVSERKDGTSFSVENTAEFLKSIASIPKDMRIEERILSYTIKMDGPMAHVWTPYEFYLNGKLSHSGVNSFQLFKEKDQWKIVYCIDTRRK